jgi:predicted transcriptional regulator
MADRLISIMVSTFDLTRTDAEILQALIQQKSGMLISDLVETIKRSERTIRQRISTLLDHGILQKEIEVLKNKRLAYRYNIKSKQTLIAKAKKHLLNKIGELNELD